MKYIIERPVEGITINGLEQLRDENDEIKIFKGKMQALKFLLRKFDKDFLKTELSCSDIQINKLEE
jgi:hypothetical protein